MLFVFALVAMGGPLAAAPGDPDVAREILRRIPEWPGTEVEVPIEVYATYLRDLLGEPRIPPPPEVAWVEKATYRLAIGQEDAAVEAVFEILVLPGARAKPVPLVADVLAWRDATLDGKPAHLRRGKHGFFYFDPPGPGRYRVTAKAPLKPAAQGDRFTAAWAVPAGVAWMVAEVESGAAWEVRFAEAPLLIVGDENGTRGAVGVPPTRSLTAIWRKPVLPAPREAQLEYASHVGWTLGDGVHQVRAALALRIWGGETAELTLSLPPGADRVAISGPDVREVQIQGAAARVFLRGAITQRTRLDVAFEVPRKSSGPMTLPEFGIVGARGRGGDLAIAGGGGAVLLEMDSPGLQPMAIRDLPDETRALLAAAPVYAYTLAPGAWSARVDLVDMAEFPVRETLADSALYTVLYRPDGHVMIKAIWEVRNRGRQFMRVDLPPGATLLVARVSEDPKSLVRGPGGELFVPLEKSVLTTAGLISFPVELVYVMRGEPLARKGRFRVPLPRTDLPVAYARCALMVPDGMAVRSWGGALREVPKWSSETAEIEFEYGRGHLAKVPEAPEPSARPDAAAYFGLAGEDLTVADEEARPQKPHEPDDASRPEAGAWAGELQTQALQGKNYYRAGVDFYNRGDYRKAGDQFGKVLQIAPNSMEAENARKYLSNVEIALGDADKGKGGRSTRAAAKAVQRGQQMGNVEIIQQQQQFLAQAEEAAEAGLEGQAEAAYKVAVDMAKELKGRGEEVREQDAVVRGATAYLEKAGEKREAQTTQLRQLEHKLQSLKEDVGKVVTRDGPVTAETLDALVEWDADGDRNGRAAAEGLRGTQMLRLVNRSADQPAQVDVSGRVLAEQQVLLGGQAVATGKPSSSARLSIDGGTLELRDQVQSLQRKVERLESFRAKLATTQPAVPPPDSEPAGERLGRKPGQPSSVERQATTNLFPDVASNKLEETEAFGLDLDLKQKVAEKQRGLADQARAAAELARKGNVAEAEALLEHTGEELARTSRIDRSLDARATGTAAAKVQGLWKRAEKARREMKFDEAGRAVGQILAAKPDDERAKVWYDDLAYLAAQARQSEDAGTSPRAARSDEDETHGASGYLRYPDAATWRKLTAQREAFQRSRSGAKPEGDGYVDAAAWGELNRAQLAIEHEKRRRASVRFDVEDIARDSDEGRKLTDFITRNYAWAFQPPPARPPGAPAVPQGQAAGQATINLNGAYAGNTVNLQTFADADYRLISPGPDRAAGGSGWFAPSSGLRLADGQIVVANDPGATGNLEVVLERLRANLGQRVAVGSRNIRVDARRAEGLGLRFTEGANGVRYVVANEGQLLGLMDLEQRSSVSPADAGALVGDVRQEAVVGTSAVLANGATVAIAHAADDSNRLSYNGNDLDVPHDEYFLVDNGGYLTAVKSGRMQHWALDVEPVRFPGVPAAVVVPAVGRTLKFEKTLLDPQDSLELVTEYTWQGDQ